MLEDITFGVLCWPTRSWRYAHMLRNPCLKMASSFTNIGGVAHPTRVFIDNVTFERKNRIDPYLQERVGQQRTPKVISSSITKTPGTHF